MIDNDQVSTASIEFHRANQGDVLESKDASLVYTWDNIPAGLHRVWVKWDVSGANCEVSKHFNGRSLTMVELP
jgi:hypothetical protein